MKKDRVEKMTRAAGLVPAGKKSFRQGEIFVADGFHLTPQKTFHGLDPKDFPLGAYATMWWFTRGEDEFMYGPVIFFEFNHDQDQGWDHDTKKKARVNKAFEEAEGFLIRMERYKRTEQPYALRH